MIAKCISMTRQTLCQANTVLIVLALYFVMDVVFTSTSSTGAAERLRITTLFRRNSSAGSTTGGAAKGAGSPGLDGFPEGTFKGKVVKGVLNPDMVCAEKIFSNATFVPTDSLKPCKKCSIELAPGFKVRLYVVGHSKYKDRQKDISEMLANYSIRGSYVRGFDAEEMLPASDDFKCMCPKNYSMWYPRTPKKGQNRTLIHTGCHPHWRRLWGPPNAAAHYSVYNDVIANNYDAGFVIEDDTIFKGDRIFEYGFPNVTEKDKQRSVGDLMREALSYIQHVVPGYDLVSVGGCFGRHGEREGIDGVHGKDAWWQKYLNDTKRRPKNMFLMHVPRDHKETARCSHGYMISKAGAAKMMRYGLPLMDSQTTGYDGIDIDMNTNEVYRQFGLDSWYLERPLACQTMGRPLVVRGPQAC